ncbi:MAG: hypothetical protein LBO81_04750, partial [Clostridiales Family XIII bacterium]|nr:hypothetical protein [Clostridiales Family XIII bacterium]
TSDKRQATRDKRQATSDKQQTTNNEQQTTSNCNYTLYLTYITINVFVCQALPSKNRRAGNPVRTGRLNAAQKPGACLLLRLRDVY